MTVRHVVLFELNDDLDDDLVVRLVHALETFCDDIDFVSGATAGRDISGRSEFGVAFSCDVPTEADLARYAAHPAHVAVVDGWVRPNCKRWVVLDHHV